MNLNKDIYTYHKMCQILLLWTHNQSWSNRDATFQLCEYYTLHL